MVWSSIPVTVTSTSRILYGFLQDFRPAPGLRNQVYRYNFTTSAVTVVADDFTLPNGITFSPDGNRAYVTDTGIALGFYGRNLSSPTSVYQFDVNKDGTWQNRKTFAYVASLIPDGVHTDSKGRVYASCGDGVHIRNLTGKLIGKIYAGTTAANFQFAGRGRMIITGQTKFFYAALAALGTVLT